MMIDNESIYCLEGIFLESVEHGREIALTRIGQQDHNVLVLISGALGNLRSGKGSSTRRDTHQHAILLRNLTTCTNGIVVDNGKHLVNDVGIVGLGHETGTNTLNLVRSGLATFQHR